MTWYQRFRICPYVTLRKTAFLSGMQHVPFIAYMAQTNSRLLGFVRISLLGSRVHCEVFLSHHYAGYTHEHLGKK